MNLELREVIEDNYSNDWIVLSSRDEITLYPETRFQEGHYGFKPKGLWLGKGTNWLDFIEEQGMDSFISSYCSAFKVDLGKNILVLKDFADYHSFTLRYGVSRGKIDWKKVANKYNGVIAYDPIRFQFNEELEWVYGWDITSACIWDADGIEDVKKVYDNCEDELFKKGGSVTTWKHKYNKKYGYPKDKSHSLKEISKDTGVSMKGIRQIYNKGIGAYKTNPSSVRPNVKSKEQWAYARVYSSLMGGKASKVDAKELKMEMGGQVCTYDFEGYEVYKIKCGENVAQYLIPAEYDRVSIWLFENEFPLWMYYNYLARITASAENILTFKTQFQKEFDLEDYNVDLNIEPESNKKFWKNQPYGKARSFMSYSEDGSGKIRSLGITLVAGGEWTKRFKERTSGLNIPHPVNGVLLNTAIHEFAHLLDVIRYNQKNPKEKIIVTHQRGFLIALRDILVECRNNKIPIVGILDNKAYLTQKLLQDEGYQEIFRKQYGVKKETRPNVLKLSINVTIPKELKEYDSKLDIKGKPLSDMEIQEIRTLIDRYKKTDLRQIAELDFKKAERLYRAINKITLELKRIEKNIAFDDVKDA